MLKGAFHLMKGKVVTWQGRRKSGIRITMKTFPLFLFLLLAMVTQVRGDEFDDVKQAVQLRSSAIQELKQRGVFHEGPGGLLEGAATEIDPAQRNLIDSENADRTRLFQLIAQRFGTTPDEVARTFARKAAAALPVTAAKPPAVPTVPDTAGKQEPLPTAEANRGGSRPIASDRSSVLPLKVLTRPFANIYATPAEDAHKVRENTPAFSAYYVYQKTDGWYEVGSDNRGKKVGWMRADDVVEWKQNLVVEFTHPEGRQPVFMFGDKAPLAQLVAKPKASRASELRSLYPIVA